MTAIADQILAANQDSISTGLDLMTKSLDGIDKLVRLNLAAAQATVGEGLAHAKSLLDAKDIQGLVSLQMAKAQPNADKALSFSRHVYEITTATQHDLSKVIESQLSQTQAKMLAVLENLAKNAPPEFNVGSPMAYVKSCMKTSATLFEQMQSTAQEVAERSTKQALSLVESSQQAVTKAAAPMLDKVA